MILEWKFRVLNDIKRIVCNDGTFYNLRGKKLRLKPSKEDYLRVRVYDGEESYKWAHRLVANTFVGPVDGKHVHHKDRNRRNNHEDNFEIKEPEEHREYHKYNKK